MTHRNQVCKDQDAESTVSLSINYWDPEGHRLNLDNFSVCWTFDATTIQKEHNPRTPEFGALKLDEEAVAEWSPGLCGIAFMKDGGEFSQVHREWFVLRTPSPQQALMSQTLFMSVLECLFSPVQYPKTDLQVTLVIVLTKFPGSCSCANNSRNPT